MGIVLSLTLALTVLPSAAGDPPAGRTEVFAVELMSADLERDVEFYTENLAFTEVKQDDKSDYAELANGGLRLILRSSRGTIDARVPQVYVNYHVDDLDSIVARLRAQGVDFVDDGPKPNAIGRAIAGRDPSGHRFNLMQIDKFPTPPAPTPRVYNIGLRFADLRAAEEFYCGALGIEASTRNYLPQTLPLRKSGGAPLVLHARDGGGTAPGDPRRASSSLVLTVANLDRTLKALSATQLRSVTATPEENAQGRYVRVLDPAGHAICIMEAKKKIDADRAKTAFEHFKKLSGAWKGKSTKGWTDTNTYRVIAAGSVVMGTSFDAHPNETMITMIHMDGDKLMLTHYCVAKNQPRMVATSISADGSEITFEFLDGTNLPSRDKGHMDSAIFRFESDKKFTSQWTWYQDGKESWMEEIRYTRDKE